MCVLTVVASSGTPRSPRVCSEACSEHLRCQGSLPGSSDRPCGGRMKEGATTSLGFREPMRVICWATSPVFTVALQRSRGLAHVKGV